MIKAIDIHIRDPYIYVENDIAYMIGTVGNTSWDGKCIGFYIYKSKDLVNFEDPVLVFSTPKDFWADHHFWAPEIHKFNGKYYILATFEGPHTNRRCQLLQADNIMGPYIPLPEPFTPEDWMSLDATLFEENGILYTIFSHEWVQIHDGEIVLAPFRKDLLGFNGKPMTLFKASEAKWAIDAEGKGNYVTDGPFIYKTKSGRLIMTWSSHCKTGYAVGICYSDDGIKGPWVHLDEPLFSKDGGHGMVFNFKGKLYLSLHRPNTPSGAERPIFLEIKEENDMLKII